MIVARALEQIDVFGLPIQLTYKKNPNHRTALGGVLSLCLLTIFFVAIYFFGKEVIERKNPTTIYNQEFQERPAVFQIKPSSFPFAFGLQDGSTWEQFIDETIYQVTAQNYIRKKVLNKQTGKSDLIEETYDVNVGPCNVKEDLSDLEETVEYFQRLDVSSMYCIKKQQNHIPEIEGQWDADHYQAIQISFQGCKNTTTYNKCKSQEEIDKKLAAGFFAMNYVDLTVNPRDPKHAYRYFGKDFYTYTSNLITKNIDIFFKHVEMNSDEGWLFEEIVSQHGIAYGDMKDMIDMRKNDVFCFVAIKLLSKGDIYTRSYKKIQNVMAEVGGFLKTILIFFLIISIPFTQLNFYVDLLNQLFIFDTYQQKPAKSDQDLDQQKMQQGDQINERKNSDLAGVLQLNSNSKDNIKRLSKGSFKRKSTYQHSIINAIQNDNSQNKSQQKYLINKDDAFKLKKGGLKLTFQEYLSYYICPKRKFQHKMIQINQTIQKIQDHLDAVYILNKLQEIDKIKMLLLTPSQIRLFDLLSKPVINLDEMNQQQNQQKQQDQVKQAKEDVSSKYLSVLNDQKSHFQKISEAYKIFEQIDEENISQFDKKLIELLDENIRKIFYKAKKKKKQKMLQIQPEKEVKPISAKDEIKSEDGLEVSATRSQHHQLYIFELAQKINSSKK